MANVREFGGEFVTATMTLPITTGEHFGSPFTVGFYRRQDEIWIDGECGRVNIPFEHVEAVIKQLRRAVKIATHNVDDSHD